jgi:tetratricopeptide (TPR) repeat protein
VRAALNWAFSAGGDARTGIALAAAYAPAWRRLGLTVECRERTEEALHSLRGSREPDARLSMLLNLEHGIALEFTMGPTDRIREVVGKALQVAEELDDTESRLRAHWTLFASYVNCGECRASLTEATRMARVAAEAGNAAARLFAERLLGVATLLEGRLREARQHFDRVLAHSALPSDDGRTLWAQYDPRILARAYLARLLFAQGFIDQAVECAQTSLQDALARDYKLAQCEAFRVAVCGIKLMTGKLLAAERSTAAYHQVAAATNSLNHENHARFFEGALLIRRREFDSGVALVQATLETRERVGWSTASAEALAVLAEGLAGLGRIEEANSAVDRAIAWTERGGERWYAAELFRLKGCLLLQSRQESAAEEMYRQAIDLAREQGAMLWELRAAMGLAGLQLRQGHRDAAGQSLTPVYEKITEGRDTVDVRAAESLLESLR